MSHLTDCELQDGGWGWILLYGSYVTQQISHKVVMTDFFKDNFISSVCIG